MAIFASGNFAPNPRAKPQFTTPATNPFHMAIWDGSPAEIFRVRLLSMPQQTHAATMSNTPPENATPPSRGSDRRTPPIKMQTNPIATLRSTFSRKATHAMSAVATASRLRSRDAALPEVVMRPNNKSTGATTPPVKIAPRSHGRASCGIAASTRRPRFSIRAKARPTPEPR